MTQSSLKTGTVTVRAGDSDLTVPFAEQPSRSGILEVVVGDQRLDARQLAALAEQLTAQERDLAEGRARYLRAASSVGILQEIEEPPQYFDLEWEQNVSPELAELVYEHGTVKGYADLDLGRPGFGSRYTLYCYEGKYYVDDDCGLHEDVGDLLAIYRSYRLLRRQIRIEGQWIAPDIKKLLHRARRERARERRQRLRRRRAQIAAASRPPR